MPENPRHSHLAAVVAAACLDYTSAADATTESEPFPRHHTYAVVGDVEQISVLRVTFASNRRS